MYIARCPIEGCDFEASSLWKGQAEGGIKTHIWKMHMEGGERKIPKEILDKIEAERK